MKNTIPFLVIFTIVHYVLMVAFFIMGAAMILSDFDVSHSSPTGERLLMVSKIMQFPFSYLLFSREPPLWELPDSRVLEILIGLLNSFCWAGAIWLFGIAVKRKTTKL